ncbi:MAG: ArsB/NhaD family transporter [Anaerolineae bacterium]|nr:ArsB/NhaD family transporter [Anaerolineae bacterium]
MLAAIGFRWMHETAAALLGAVAIWLVHYIGGTFFPSLRIINFEEAMAFVDWNVIFLILGMMIFMAMFSETGILRWLAFRAFRLAGGNVWLLGLILLLLTGVTSSFLNNVTAMLLLVPLSIQIAQAAGLHPFTYVIPEVLAANIGGAATLIGDPPSTIVGSAIGLGFFEYAIEAAVVVLVSLALLVGLTAWLYRRDLAGAKKEVSPSLIRQLESGARITDPALLRKAGAVGLVTLVLFLIGDLFGLPASVIAMTGAVSLIVWVRPDMHRMMREVDWTTLFFFIGIFVVVGGLERAGAIEWVAHAIGSLAGGSKTLATILMVWVSGGVSGTVDNIPFTVAALPIAEELTNTIVSTKGSPVLYWALILGADLGSNLTYVGGAANIVAVGLLAQAGYRVTFGRFVRDGIVVTVATLLVATVWLLIRY